MMTCCSDTEDVFNDVFSVLDEDNESYLDDRSKFISSWERKDTSLILQRSCDPIKKKSSKMLENQHSYHRSNFFNLYAESESRHCAYKAEVECFETLALEHEAAIVIQETWRRYILRRIYRRIRDLLIKYSSYNSSALLRPVNPREADLMDRASGTFIRFRLSGETFPPFIVYKIFTKRPIVDLCKNNYPFDVSNHSSKTRSTMAENCFERKMRRKKIFSEKEIARNFYGSQLRYQRVDKNDWRPFLGSLIEKPRALNLPTADKNVINTKATRKRRLKLELMKRLYENGRRNEGIKARDLNGT